METTEEGKKIIEPKRIIGVGNNPNQLFTIRSYHIEGMQESICPYYLEVLKEYEEILTRKKNKEYALANRLPADSEEQLRYNKIISGIVEYDNYRQYKYKTSFKYKVLKFLKLTKNGSKKK